MRLDDSGVLLAVTKWEILGFMESTVVRWLGFQMLDKDEISNILCEEDFLLRMSIEKGLEYSPELSLSVQQKV